MQSAFRATRRNRWGGLSLLMFLAPLAMLNPSLADPLKQLETGFCAGCALCGNVRCVGKLCFTPHNTPASTVQWSTQTNTICKAQSKKSRETIGCAEHRTNLCLTVMFSNILFNLRYGGLGLLRCSVLCPCIGFNNKT